MVDCFDGCGRVTKAGMPSVGEQLRQGRERRQLSVTEVANSTNIKSDYIRAMEEGDWGTFSAPVYIKGFVRTYATHLKLDVSTIVSDLEAELSANPELSEPPSLTGGRRGVVDWVMLQFSRVRWVIVFPILVGVGVLVAGYFGLKAWKKQGGGTPPATLGPGLQQRGRPGVPTTLPVPTNAPAPVRPGR